MFAMQLLTADESAAIAQHIESCGECRRELAAVQGDLAIYAHTVDLHSPPALARERLLKQVAREKKVIPVAPHSGGDGVSGAASSCGLVPRSGSWSREQQQQLPGRRRPAAAARFRQPSAAVGGLGGCRGTRGGCGSSCTRSAPTSGARWPASPGSWRT